MTIHHYNNKNKCTTIKHNSINYTLIKNNIQKAQQNLLYNNNKYPSIIELGIKRNISTNLINFSKEVKNIAISPVFYKNLEILRKKLKDTNNINIVNNNNNLNKVNNINNTNKLNKINESKYLLLKFKGIQFKKMYSAENILYLNFLDFTENHTNKIISINTVNTKQKAQQLNHLINITKMRLLDKHYTNEVIMIQDEINKLIVFEALQYFRGIFCEDEAFSVEIFNLRLNRHILLIENLLCNLEYAINRINLLYNKYLNNLNFVNCNENFSMLTNNTFAYDLAIKAFLNNYYNISNKIYYIIQNNIESSELNIKNLGISNCSFATTRTTTGLFKTNSESFITTINRDYINNNNNYSNSVNNNINININNNNIINITKTNNKLIKTKSINTTFTQYNTLLFNYLKRMSIYNIKKNGLLIYNYHILKYNFNKNNSLIFNPILSKIHTNSNKFTSIKGTGWTLSNEIHNFLKAFFKSINSLISKPTFVITPDKITISLFYYLSIPNPKIFNLYNLLIKNNKKLNKSSKLDKKTFTIKKSRAFKNFICKHNDLKNKLNLFNSSNLTKLYPLRFKKICDYLSVFFNKPVEFELIRLHHSYHDTYILVTLLALIVKRKNIRGAIAKLYSKNAVINLNDPNLLGGNRSGNSNQNSLKTQYNIPAFLSGLNIKIAGRLMREPIIPRKTTKIFEKGASATGKVNFIEVAKLTKKNRKGAFTITVLSGQNFF